MKLASRLRFVQRCDALPMQCGDATAMWPRRRRCNRAETGAETGAVCAQDRFKIDAEFRQNNDKIQTSYMQIQTCMYVLVSIPKMQTSYRLNRNAILFRWNPHSCKYMHILFCLYWIQTCMYQIQTCLYEVCMCMYFFAHTYKISQLLCCLYVLKNTYKYKHARFLMKLSQ
jgi:hypothetical protein